MVDYGFREIWLESLKKNLDKYIGELDKQCHELKDAETHAIKSLDFNSTQVTTRNYDNAFRLRCYLDNWRIECDTIEELGLLKEFFEQGEK